MIKKACSLFRNFMYICSLFCTNHLLTFLSQSVVVILYWTSETFKCYYEKELLRLIDCHDYVYILEHDTSSICKILFQYRCKRKIIIVQLILDNCVFRKWFQSNDLNWDELIEAKSICVVQVLAALCTEHPWLARSMHLNGEQWKLQPWPLLYWEEDTPTALFIKSWQPGLLPATPAPG